MKKTVTLPEQKQILIEIMDEIDFFCRHNNIRYFLIGGSLIGCIRHKGFIPWDDDIDIAMLRSDYEKFIKLYPKHITKHTKLLSLETDSNYGYGFAKVIDLRTELIELIDNGDKLGVYVDVFPLDNCKSTIEEAEKHVRLLIFLKWLRNFKIIRFNKKRSILKNIILAIGKILTLPISRRYVSELMDKYAKKYINTESMFVAQMAGNVYGVKEILRKEWLDDTIEGEFEGRYYLIPKCYDEVLKRIYGEYMVLPPVEKRVSTHDAIVYWK